MVVKLLDFAGGRKSLDSNRIDVDNIYFDLDSIKNKNYLTHNFHPYPAKFIPQVPRMIIETLSEPHNTILDPFCGCGTSLVEAKLVGRHSIGIDINPLACLVSKVKATPLEEKFLVEAVRISERASRNINRFYGKSIFGKQKMIEFTWPNFYNLNYWFKPSVCNELAIIKSHIDEVVDKNIKDFLNVAFSSIIVRVSNQESDTRYAAIEKNLEKGKLGEIFSFKIQDMTQRMREFRRVCKHVGAKVYCADSKNLNFLNDEYFDLIVTSPPYLNTYDYYLYHKHRMQWLGLDYREAQSKEIGSRHKHCDKGEGLDTFVNGMGKTINEMSRLLKPMGYCCMVVGDSILKGEFIKMDNIMNKLSSESNLTLKKEIIFNQRKYSKTFTPNIKRTYKNSYILIYQKE